MARRIWIDGRLVPWEEATVHVLSHSLQRGSLVFDYLSVHRTPRGPAVFRLAEHVDRFLRSCELVGLPLRQDAAGVRAAILEAVRANPGATAVKACAYLPSIEIDVVPVDDDVALCVAAYDPFEDVLGRKRRPFSYSAHLRLWIEKDIRNRRADIVPPQAKVAANYVAPMIAKWRAKKQGYDDIVLVDEEGYLAEAPTSNVFLVDGEGVLRTPPEQRVLLGVTRASVLALAKHRGIPVREEPVRPEALLEASEAFLTGTTAGVWPVASVDGRPLGGEKGAPGPVTAVLREHFERVVSGRDPAFEHWLTHVED